jgi:hypothetical protein
MSVLSVTEIYTNRGGQTGDKDADIRTFQVITSDGRDNKYRILNSGMVPVRGSSHSTQSNLFCKNVDCQPDSSVKSPRHWIVKAEYDNQPFGALPNLSSALNINPLLRAVEIEGKSIIARAARTDGRLIATRRLSSWAGGTGLQIPQDLTPFENTAHEAFEGHEEDIHQWIIEVTINAETVPIWIADYQGSINRDSVTIRGYPKPFPRWSLMVKGFQHSKQLDEKLPNGAIVSYIQSKFSLHFKRGLWVVPVRNEGYYELVNNEKLKAIRIAGSKPTAKVLLNENGTVMDNPTAENALYRFYADGPEADFSVFNLS